MGFEICGKKLFVFMCDCFFYETTPSLLLSVESSMPNVFQSRNTYYTTQQCCLGASYASLPNVHVSSKKILE